MRISNCLSLSSKVGDGQIDSLEAPPDEDGQEVGRAALELLAALRLDQFAQNIQTVVGDHVLRAVAAEM